MRVIRIVRKIEHHLLSRLGKTLCPFLANFFGILTQFSDTGLANSQMKLDILGNLQTNVPRNLRKGVAMQEPVVCAVLSVNVTCQESDCHYMFHATNSEKIKTKYMV